MLSLWSRISLLTLIAINMEQRMQHSKHKLSIAIGIYILLICSFQTESLAEALRVSPIPNTPTSGKFSAANTITDVCSEVGQGQYVMTPTVSWYKGRACGENTAPTSINGLPWNGNGICIAHHGQAQRAPWTGHHGHHWAPWTGTG